MAKLNAQQEEFFQGLELGLTPVQSAKRAKYKAPKDAVHRLMKHPEFKERLAALQGTVQREFSITRMDVQRGIMEAIDMARLQSDPLAMIRGFQEVNKMCGYYAPEEKRVTLTDGQSGVLRQMQSMPLEELIEMADGEIIEADLLDQ